MLIDFKYLFEKYNVKCTGLLHCGASFCQERDTYEELQIPEVIWIEAIPYIFESAKEIIRYYPNQVIINACLSDDDGQKVQFNISNNEAQSSSFLELGHHATIHPEVHFVEQIELTTVRLDTLFNYLERDIDHINFGNFDLQGVELMALKGLGKLINQFDYLYLELNKKETYKGCALVDEVDAFLKDFARVEIAAWIGDTWTDGFYVRKSLL